MKCGSMQPQIHYLKFSSGFAACQALVQCFSLSLPPCMFIAFSPPLLLSCRWLMLFNYSQSLGALLPQGQCVPTTCWVTSQRLNELLTPPAGKPNPASYIKGGEGRCEHNGTDPTPPSRQTLKGAKLVPTHCKAGARAYSLNGMLIRQLPWLCHLLSPAFGSL